MSHSVSDVRDRRAAAGAEIPSAMLAGEPLLVVASEYGFLFEPKGKQTHPLLEVLGPIAKRRKGADFDTALDDDFVIAQAKLLEQKR